MLRIIGNQRRRTRELFALGAAALGLLLCTCNGPQAPAPGSVGSDLEASWRAGKLEFRLTADGQPTSLFLVASGFEFDPANDHLSALVTVRNDGSEPVVGPQSIVVFGFLPADVTPVNAQCEIGAPFPADACAFDHRDTYGDDGRLEPGESSAPVTWTFLDPGGQSFAFRASFGPREGGPGSIAGVVYEDSNRDGKRNPGEPGIEAIEVRLRGEATEKTDSTGAAGRFEFHVTRSGIYAIDLVAPPDWQPNAPLPLLVTIFRQPDGSFTQFGRADIGLVRGGDGDRVEIEGWVFDDTNRDGRFDTDEHGISGVVLEGRVGGDDDDDVVITDDDDDESPFRAVSDAQGHYVLHLPAGPAPWEVVAGSLDGYDRTTPKHVRFTEPPPEGEALRADFGYAVEAAWSKFEVKGRVFLDTNRNGQRDPGELGIAGIHLSLEGTACADAPAVVDSTNASGRYSLDGAEMRCDLPWVVSRALMPAYEPTSPRVVHLDTPPQHDHTFVVDFGVVLRPPGP